MLEAIDGLATGKAIPWRVFARIQNPSNGETRDVDESYVSRTWDSRHLFNATAQSTETSKLREVFETVLAPLTGVSFISGRCRNEALQTLTFCSTMGSDTLIDDQKQAAVSTTVYSHRACRSEMSPPQPFLLLFDVPTPDD